MMVMGNRVQRGGQVLGHWPTLHPSQLDDGDLRIETDDRDVLAEVLSVGLGGTDLGHVFSGHTPSPVGAVT